ncbi:MAG: hypothetical protein IKX14_02770, partial [Neisseriaceae bacterium]|nr:hypothetical protein [Neisseriaceae bacterium]
IKLGDNAESNSGNLKQRRASKAKLNHFVLRSFFRIGYPESIFKFAFRLILKYFQEIATPCFGTARNDE